MTAIYLSMSAKEKDLEIEDDLARSMLYSRNISAVLKLILLQPKRIYET